MKSIFNRFAHILTIAIVALSVSGCGYKVTYNLSGGSIPPAAQTFSVAYFPNNAPMVAPSLSNALTEGLRDKFSRQTRLQQVDEGGDFAFEGEITNYTSTPSSVTAAETAAMNRLTITVKVKFTTIYEPHNNYNKSFSAFAEYDATSLLQDVQENHLTSAFMKRTENFYITDW